LNASLGSVFNQLAGQLGSIEAGLKVQGDRNSTTSTGATGALVDESGNTFVDESGNRIVYTE
jgi:hypothetical protein